MTKRRARYRYPAGAKINGKSVGGRFTTPSRLQAYARRQRRIERRREQEVAAVESVEWEIAVDYNASAYGGSKSKGVDVNIRLRRVDGRPFGFDEAYDAWSIFQYEHELPPDYEIAAIDWRRPESADRSFSSARRDPRRSEALANLLPPLVNADDVNVQLHLGELRDEYEWRFGAIDEG